MGAGLNSGQNAARLPTGSARSLYRETHRLPVGSARYPYRENCVIPIGRTYFFLRGAYRASSALLNTACLTVKSNKSKEFALRYFLYFFDLFGFVVHFLVCPILRRYPVSPRIHNQHRHLWRNLRPLCIIRSQITRISPASPHRCQILSPCRP
jgi:hypothetical protein